MEEAVVRRRDLLAKHNSTVQPFLVCIGTLDNITEAYCVINDIKYQVQTPLKALEITFKLFHSMDAKYPVESFHVWLFIQQYVFNLYTPHDVNSPAVTSLISDLQKHY